MLHFFDPSVVAENVVEAEIEATATEEEETAIGMTEAAGIVKYVTLKAGDQMGKLFRLCKLYVPDILYNISAAQLEHHFDETRGGEVSVEVASTRYR